MWMSGARVYQHLLLGQLTWETCFVPLLNGVVIVCIFLRTSLEHGHLLTGPSVNCKQLTTSHMQGYEPFQVILVLSLTILNAVSKTIGTLQKLPGSCFFF